MMKYGLLWWVQSDVWKLALTEDINQGKKQ